MKKMNNNDEIVITLKSYIYLDEFEINGLYNQIYPNILEETTKYESKKNNALDGNVGGSVLGVINAQGALKHTSDNSVSNEVKTNVPIEYKANVLIQHVCNNQLKHLSDVIEIAKAANSLLRGRIIAGFAMFGLMLIYDSKDQLIELHTLSNNFDRKNSTFVLESGCRKELEKLGLIDESDFYYGTRSANEGKYGFEMHMSGNKIRREVRHLTQVIKRGKAFNFAVLGHLSYAGANQYSIKPFAVW